MLYPCIFNTQLRPNKSCGYQLLRTCTTTSALKNAFQIDQPTTKVVEDLHLTEEEGPAYKPRVEPSQSPVCAYNEWDPLEASILHSPYCDNDLHVTFYEHFVASLSAPPFVLWPLSSYTITCIVITKTIGSKLQTWHHTQPLGYFSFLVVDLLLFWRWLSCHQLHVGWYQLSHRWPCLNPMLHGIAVY